MRLVCCLVRDKFMQFGRPQYSAADKEMSERYRSMLESIMADLVIMGYISVSEAFGNVRPAEEDKDPADEEDPEISDEVRHGHLHVHGC